MSENIFCLSMESVISNLKLNQRTPAADVGLTGVALILCPGDRGELLNDIPLPGADDGYRVQVKLQDLV